MMREGASYRFHEHDSDRLIVWFGGVNEPSMSDTLAQAARADLLALIDHRHDWYTRGTLPEHSTVAEGIAFLRLFIHAKYYRSVTFCGQSSGGYGALFYAYHCGVPLCIAFAPQTRNFVDGHSNMSPHILLEDIGALYRSGSATRIVVNASRSEKTHDDRFFWDDWRHIRQLENYPHLTIISHPYEDHSVTVRLRHDGRLYRFVTALIDAFEPPAL